MKLFTRVYPFFDGVNVSRFVVPKLIEIEMETGVFEVGETVCSFDYNRKPVPGDYIQFRVAQQNHKYGAYNAPTDVFTTNPYDQSVTISDTYSTTSTTLNVDTYSLANQPQGQFYGKISTGMKLRGKTSGAIAKITNVRLITDHIGTLIGSYFIPDPNLQTNPKFEAGTKLFRLTSSDTNSQIPGSTTTSAEDNYFVEGKVNTVQEQIISIRNSKIVTEKPVESENVSKEESPVVVDSKVLRNIPRPRPAAAPAPRGGGGGGGGRVYNGVASGYIVATGTYGTIDQNAGGYSPWRVSVGQPAVISTPAIGVGGVQRALASGYSLAQVSAWAYRTGATIGPEAQARYRLSDINLKRNITPIDNALNRLTNMSL